jgi:hypothetical protein
MRVALIVALSVVACGTLFGGAAQAAAPAWKLLAVTGPTNLPTRQSETQRVTVEAEGGDFTLTRKAVATGTPVVETGSLTYTAGSNEATIDSVSGAAGFEVGSRLTEINQYEPGKETTVVSCSVDCRTPGSTVTLSEPAATSDIEAPVQIYTRKITGIASGTFLVGDEVQGVAFQYFPPGTTVETISPGTLTLSKATSFEYIVIEGAIKISTPEEVTAPIAFDASPSAVGVALDALPRFGPGSVAVTGGPGGSVENPYSLTFGGPLADVNVPELEADAAGLLGAHAAARVSTVVPGGLGTGEISISPVNIGGAATSGVTTLRLGPLPEGIVTAGVAEGEEWSCPGGPGESTVVCTSSASTPALEVTNAVKVPVEVEQSAPANLSVPVTIEGGNASGAAYQLPIVISNQQAPFGVQAFWAGAFDANGNPETQAGAHPFSAQTFFLLNTVRATTGKIVPSGDSRNVRVDLPPGFLGNPLVTQRCPQAQLTNPALGGGEGPLLCNEEMTVGKLAPALVQFGSTPLLPAAYIFNDVPAYGHAAEFTTIIAHPLQSLIGSVRGSEDFGVTIVAPNNPNLNKIYGAFAAIEGQPASAHGSAFLDNPTACAQQREESARGSGPLTRIEASSWQAPSNFDARVDPLPLLTNCEPLTEAWVGNGPDPANEKPSFTFEPSTSEGSSPAGATAHLHIPQPGLTDPSKRVTSHLKKAVVTLPQGLTVNPSAANGLAACSEEQIGLLGTSFPSPTPIRFDEETPSCPDGSKLGSFELSTPLLEEAVGGTIYLAEQNENPFGSLIALYLVVESERFGLTVKIPGEVKPDPSTGQLTATFDNNPQLPFEDLTLHFRGGGPRSELATPEVCGHYETTGSLAPWSAEAGEAASIAEAGFTVSSNCASSPGARLFSPSFEAGTTEPRAGAFSPLIVKVSRKDGEQELRSLEFTMPPGISAKLAGIPYCSEAEIASAESKSGKAEQSSPSCPSASTLGSTAAAAGVGPEPFHAPGAIYLAGPYKGAPLSAVVITPAVAGPFDLGNVIIRSPLHIDPKSAQVTATSDPIPTILQGIPLKVREVVVKVDRSDFALNPTNCEAMKMTAQVGSSDGATASPENRFQVGECGKLAFKPKMTLRLKGGTKRASNPKLIATVYSGGIGSAGLASAQVKLPRSAFLDQSHIRTVCTRVQFAAGDGNGSNCPKGSIYGKVWVKTPLFDYWLTGNIFLRSSNHKLPDLILSLKGPDSQPIAVELSGKTDSVKGALRNTFEAIPDAPFEKARVVLFGGKRGLIVNSRNLCANDYRAKVRLVGQNGMAKQLRPLVRNSCGGKGRRGKQRREAKREH